MRDMKAFTWRGRSLGLLFLTATLSFKSVSAQGAQAEASMTEQIRQAAVFTHPLVWSGAGQPDAAQSQTLWQAIQRFSSEGRDAGIGGLESFIKSNPQSGWTPSLRAHLGKYYRQRGLYTPALEHWEQAWALTKGAEAGNAKQVGDFVLAHWTRLLGSLGRKNEVAAILEETKNRRLDAIHLHDMLQANREANREMKRNPGVAYKCGTFALTSIARLAPDGFAKTRPIWSIPSPETGFSMEQLTKFAKSVSLDLVPVRRNTGTEQIIVPSVIHWKQGHYAAVVSKRGNLFKVVDPTFGEPLWMTGAAINSESSGYFMIPKRDVGSGWRQMEENEAKTVHGKGVSILFIDGVDCDGNIHYHWEGTEDAGGNYTVDGDAGTISCVSNCGGGGAGASPVGDGGGEGSGCDDCESGMPRWTVSQPGVNLLLSDIPMLYKTAYGTTVKLGLRYKQRGMNPYETNMFGFGQGWFAKLSSYMVVQEMDSDPEYANYSATVYTRMNRTLTYQFDETSPNYYNRSTFERILDSGSLVGFKITYADGSQDIYGHLEEVMAGEIKAYLTEHRSPQSRTSYWQYTTNSSVLQLARLIDDSGQTNSFAYSTNSPWLITKMTNPFGHEVAMVYNSSGYLTNITDVVGIASSFLYDGDGAVTNLTTPYGTTSFTYTKSPFTCANVPAAVVHRALKVTTPNGAEHLYQLLIWAYIRSIVENPLAEWFYRDEETASFTPGNSYWGPRQLSGLSTNNMLYFTTNDYVRGAATLYQGSWSEASDLTPVPTPYAYRLPSQDGTTEGQKYFLGYPGSPEDIKGNSNLPDTRWYVLPDGTTNVTTYARNEQGNPTNIVSTYSIDGSIYTRTNHYVYASNGIDLLQHIGASGHVEAAYGYNTNHQVLTITNAANYVTIYTYNTNSQLTSMVAPSGLTTTNIYDTNGWLATTIDLEIGRTNTFTWTNGLLYSHVNESGLALTNMYDALRRRTSTIYPDGTTVSNVYTLLDLTGRKDRLGNWTYRAYDSVRQMILMTNALGYVTQYGYCVCGSLESVTNALGQVTTFTYNNRGEKTSAIDADLNPTTYTYDKLGRIFYVTDSLNRSTTNYYSNQGLVVAVSNALGRIKAIAYSIEDLATNMVDANGVNISVTYDEAHRVLTRTYPDTGVEQYSYSARGLVAYTNQLNKVTRYGYDVARRKTSETNANNEVVSYTYNAKGKKLTLTDGKSQTTAWNYDEYGRETNKVDALTNVIFVYKYDANGRLTNRWSATKGNTYYAYNAMGSLTNVDYAVSTDIRMQHDALQRLTNMVDAVGTTKYTYTITGQLQSEDGPWGGDTMTYTYTANRMRESMSLPGADGRTWAQNYAYDSGNRLDETTSNAGTFDYVYKTGASSLVQELLLPGGSKVINTHDVNSRLVSTKIQNSSASIVNQHSYVYNVGNQRAKQTFTEGNYVDYTYDDIGQLRTAVGYESGGLASRLHEQIGYDYDASGNLNSRTNNAFVQDFNVNALNQLTSVERSGTYTVAGNVANGVSPISVTVNGLSASVYGDLTFAKPGFSLFDGTNSFTAIAHDAASQSETNVVQPYLPNAASYVYDLNGNLLSDGRRAFTYDDENQLESIVITNELKNEFVYDGKMRRKIKRYYIWDGLAWLKTDEVHYLYDNNLVVQEFHEDANLVVYTRGVDASATLQGMGGIGGLLARSQYDPAVDGIFKHAMYHVDGSGNVSTMVNTEGAVVAMYGYDPFGRLLKSSGLLAEENTYRFSSKETDVGTGLVYFTFRYYDANLQRWTNRDPLQEKGGINLYAFVMNSPIDLQDSFGLSVGNMVASLSSACGAINNAVNSDLMNCLCGVVGFADLFSNGPLAELSDCFCNIMTSASLACDQGLSLPFWAYTALTAVDCVSAPVALVLGCLTGAAVSANPGGCVLGAIVGLTPAGSLAVDLAAWFAQNGIVQGTPFPVSQCNSCLNLLGL